MATQSLYRRYRPRRFADLRGQDHVVRALRDSVRTGREGQAYLFSGPRGTGKTSSARILAKVLNCEAPVDGEPCCTCSSCVAIERGISYDVHELDAASNNGVDNIRELIERSAISTPGRHKVYILDEVHMLSRGAAAALLKILEEPPDHVVFILATTDPNKLPDTIRSRTQHLQFHLLGADALVEHMRWIVEDAGLEVDDATIVAAVQQGAGSVRDTLTALELLAVTGGAATTFIDLDIFVTAIGERDTAAALAAVAEAIHNGNDPRALTEALVRRLRDCFMALMAPGALTIPSTQIAALTETARSYGPAVIVRAIERLGAALIEMRAAPDPRLFLEIALVQLTHSEVTEDLESINVRLTKVEDALRRTPPSGGSGGSGGTAAPPKDPVTQRAQVGGRARRPVSAGGSAATGEIPVPESPGPQTPAPQTPTPQTPAPAAAASTTPQKAPAPTKPSTSAKPSTSTKPSSPAQASKAKPAAPANGSYPPATAEQLDTVPALWADTVRNTVKPMARALYAGGNFLEHDGTRWYFSVQNPAHAERCERHRAEIETALSQALGATVLLTITATDTTRSTEAPVSAGGNNPDPSGATSAPPPIDDDIPDPDELVDVPPQDIASPVDRLAQAFPGAELISDEQR